MHCIRKLTHATTSALALSVSTGAMANDAEPKDSADAQAAAANQGNQIAEIIVTANRRGESAQNVPVAVAAFSGDAALSRGVTDTISLVSAVPGLQIDRAPGSFSPFLRGVGSTISTVGAEPSVSLYVDDVYAPSSTSFFANFNNVDRIEVLKGPQGTLFGRNATGGVIQVFTRNPSATPEFDMTAGYANYETIDGSLYASGGLGEGVSANISLYGSHQGKGWGKNQITGKDAYKTNWDFGGRVKLLLESGSNTSVLITADYDKSATSRNFYRPAKGTVSYGFVPGPSGFYDNNDLTDPQLTTEQYGVSAKITHDVDWAKFVSITAYRNTDQTVRENIGGVEVPLFLADYDAYNKTFTQELQILSPEGSPVTWLAGVFYLRDTTAYNPLQLSGLAFGGAALQSYARQKTTSFSGFGQITAPLEENTHLTLGLRYTSDEKKARASSTVNGAFSAPAPDSPQSAKFDKVTWRAALDHKITDDVMIYASYNRGFKSGAFNLVVFPGAPIGTPVKPEILDAYAIGEKAEFLDRSLQINAEGFYYKFKNIQTLTISNGIATQTNAGAATIKGVDVDIRAIPVKNLTLTAAFEYLDAKYDSFANGTFSTYAPGCAPIQSNCQTGRDLAGYKLPRAAPFSASFAVDYLQPTSIGNFNFNVSYSRGGNYYFDPDNGRGQLDPSITRQPKLNLVNASVRWASTDERFDATLWGRNITDQKYLAAGSAITFVTWHAPAPPATYGITLGAHF